MTKLKMLLIMTGLLALSVSAHAGGYSSGGGQEILQSVINANGGQSEAAGGYKLYSSVGQTTASDQATAGAYTLAGGFLAVVDETPPTIAFSNPAASSSQSGNLTVAGTALDLNGTQWTLYYGPGASPTAWKEITSGTNVVNNSTFSDWDASGKSGTYTLKVIAVDSRGNTAQGTVTFSVSDTVTISGALPAFQWTLLSLPVEPGVSDPVSLFGAGEYKIYRYSPDQADDANLGRYRYPDALHAGYGYWIKSYYNDLPYSITGTVVDTTQDYALSLKSGWNQVGTPFNRSFPVAGMQVRHGGSTYDLTTAAGMGLISMTMQEYDSTNKTWTQLDSSGDLASGHGCFIRAFQDVDLVFGPGSGLAGGLARRVRIAYDYKLKISASAPHSADTDNYIGTNNLAAAGFDAWDAEEPPRTPEDSYTSLFFPRADLPATSGRLTNDVRAAARSAGTSESWDFVVETNETGETVTLNWDNSSLPTTLYSFVLINLETGEQIDMAALDNYSFNAPGGGASQSSFKIQVTRLALSEQTAVYTLQPGWNLISVPLDPVVTDALTHLGDDLPNLDIYQYYDGRFYAAAETDIQAGIGYWVYVAQGTEIDIQGPPAAGPITMPLAKGWNIIGNPFNEPLSWDNNITLDCGAEAITLEQAIAANILSGTIYLYDGSAYAPQEPGSSLQPWKGYFVKATARCDVILAQ